MTDTYVAVSFGDSTGDRWDYGRYSLYASQAAAIKDLENAGDLEILSHHHEPYAYILRTDGSDIDVYFTEMTYDEARASNLHIPD